MGHDINVMYFSEVMQLKLVTFCDYKQMHAILYKTKFHALLVPYKPTTAFNNNYGHIYLLVTNKLVPSSSQNWCPKSYKDANTLLALSTSSLCAGKRSVCSLE